MNRYRQAFRHPDDADRIVIYSEGSEPFTDYDGPVTDAEKRAWLKANPDAAME